MATSSESVEVIQPSTLELSPLEKASNEEPNFQMIKVSRQQTASFFEGDIEITTAAIEYSGSPLIHRVTFSVLIPGNGAQKFEKVDPGFEAKVGVYQILVTATETFSATYKVFKLE